jgi:hypothetical protein
MVFCGAFPGLSLTTFGIQITVTGFIAIVQFAVFTENHEAL